MWRKIARALLNIVLKYGYTRLRWATPARAAGLGLAWIERAAQPVGDATTLLYLAQIRRERGDLAAADAHTRRALRLDPTRTGALTSLGIMLAAQGRFAEAEDACRVATEAGDGAAAYYLGGILANRGRLEEADAIFRRDLPIPVSATQTTSTRILRCGSAFARIIATPAAERIVLAPPDGGAVDAPLVYFLCCDQAYFDRFGPAAVRAFRANAAMDAVIHLHLINPAPCADEAVRELNDGGGRGQLVVTRETIALDHLDDMARRTFLASRRFAILPELLGLHGDKIILCADVDQLVMRPVGRCVDEMQACDISAVHDPLNAANLLSFFSASVLFIRPTPAAARFFEAVRRYVRHFTIQEPALLWHLDQAALAVAHLSSRGAPDAAVVRFLPPEILHSSADGRAEAHLGSAVFWSITYSVAANETKLRTRRFLQYAEPRRGTDAG